MPGATDGRSCARRPPYPFVHSTNSFTELSGWSNSTPLPRVGTQQGQAVEPLSSAGGPPAAHVVLPPRAMDTQLSGMIDAP